MSHYGLDAKNYRVTISTLGGAAPADGFIDHLTVAARMALGDAAPTTLAQVLGKERGNSRYQTLVNTLGVMSNMTITNQIATGATATAAATSFQFDVLLERGDDCIANEGQTGLNALKRLVGRALMIARTDRTDYFDPTQSAAKGDNAGANAARIGDTVADVEVAALAATIAAAEAAISISTL